jgi:hypothetical protein
LTRLRRSAKRTWKLKATVDAWPVSADDLGMERRTLKLVVASSLVVAGFLAVFVREDRPRAVYVAAYVILVVSFVSLGLLGRWHALPVFTVTYGIGCGMWQVFWWTDDPMMSGIDDIPPIGAFFVTAPYALLLIAAGWASASVVERLRKR